MVMPGDNVEITVELGKPIAMEPVASPGPRHDVLPLDLWIVDFAQ